MASRKKAKALLFDLDGVIVSSDRLHFDAWKRLCDEHGWFFDEKLNDKLRGVTRMESLEIIISDNNAVISESVKVELAEKKNEHYKAAVSKMTMKDAIPGAVEFVKSVRALGIKTAICSASRNTHLVLGTLGIQKLFDVVISGGDVKNSKPAPDVFLAAAEKLNISPSECIVFEDAESGVEAARRAGMRFVAFRLNAECGHGGIRLDSFADADINMIIDITRTH